MRIVKIYTLSCPIFNDVRYVGKTIESLEKRFNRHMSCAKIEKSYKANWINSLLKINQKPIIELVDECNVDNWEIIERYWIAQFKAWGFKLTNHTEGGENSGSRLNKPWSELQRLNNKIARTGLPVKHTIEGEQNRIKGRRKYFDDNKKLILQYDLEGNFIKEWESAVDAGKELNILYPNINASCKKSNLIAYGYLWKYKEKEIINKIQKYIVTPKINSKAVIQLNKQNEIINEFKTILEAHRTTGILNTSISNCLGKKSKSAGGFKWEYK